MDDWSIRAGKQQVVWGTADGMKLLDMINPTDYSEMAQNQMEDSRIPVWMVNAEKTNEDGSEFQVVVSQPRENVFAGLDRNVSTSSRDNGTSQLATNFDESTWGTYGVSGAGFLATHDTTDATSAGHSQGHAFIMKGVDSITGKTNGFVNIVPDLGSVATRFYNEFCQGDALGCGTLQSANYITVDTFANLTGGTIGTSFADYQSMVAFSAGLDGAGILNGFAGAYDTNLTDAGTSTAWRADVDSTFEYMKNATFSTFDAFAGAHSEYVYNMPENTDLDLAMRYKNSTPDGMNYSLNYSYNYDKNPIINISWRDSSSGALLKQTRSHAVDAFAAGNPATTSIKLTSLDGNTRYGGYGASGTSAGDPTLRFEQTVKRAHNIGGSFDTAVETEVLGPVVLRGEALYQKGVYSPVMDLTALSIGDLPNALKMEKGNRFKYVLGADITALTNMMISAQFIQDRNLNHIDASSTIDGNSSIASLGRHTADYSTMSMSNNFNKAEKDKNFYSLFFSKPFGASGEHRWNNITMYEENGGKWNRLDAEFSIDDDTQATVEYNKYWGNENTQFGQLEKSSNIQVGVKYSF